MSGNSTLFNSTKGDQVFPITPPTATAPGTLDNMTIGSTTPAAGSFTTVNATAFTTTAIAALSAAPSSTLTTTQILSLTTTQLGGLTTTSVIALSALFLANFNAP